MRRLTVEPYYVHKAGTVAFDRRSLPDGGLTRRTMWASTDEWGGDVLIMVSVVNGALTRSTGS